MVRDGVVPHILQSGTKLWHGTGVFNSKVRKFQQESGLARNRSVPRGNRGPELARTRSVPQRKYRRNQGQNGILTVQKCLERINKINKINSSPALILNRR